MSTRKKTKLIDNNNNNNNPESFLSSLTKYIRTPPTPIDAWKHQFVDQIVESAPTHLVFHKGHVLKCASIASLTQLPHFSLSVSNEGRMVLTIEKDDPLRAAKRNKQMEIPVPVLRPPIEESVQQLIPVINQPLWNDMMARVAMILPLCVQHKHECVEGRYIHTKIVEKIYQTELSLLAQRPEFKEIYIHATPDGLLDVKIDTQA